MNGKLIVLEGLDGSGKATQAGKLEAVLRDKGRPVRRIEFPDYREPSSALVKMYLGGAFGDDPQDVNAYAASSFYAVDRYASYKRFWQGDYERGTRILCDRYVTSNAIYQMVKLPEQNWKYFLNWLSDYEYGKLELPRPDLVIYLDMPPEISQRLLSGRYGGDESRKDIHESHLDFLRRCREAALYAADYWGWRKIDCSAQGDPRSVGQIAEDVFETVSKEDLF